MRRKIHKQLKTKRELIAFLSNNFTKINNRVADEYEVISDVNKIEIYLRGFLSYLEVICLESEKQELIESVIRLRKDSTEYFWNANKKNIEEIIGSEVLRTEYNYDILNNYLNVCLYL